MGMRAAFVLSGKYPDQSVIGSIPMSERPDIIARTIGELLTEGALEL